MQADPIEPKLKPPGSKRLTLNCDALLSNCRFEFNLRRYTEVESLMPAPARINSVWECSETSLVVDTCQPELQPCGNCTAFTELPRTVDGRGLHSFTLDHNLSNSGTHS